MATNNIFRETILASAIPWVCLAAIAAMAPIIPAVRSNSVAEAVAYVLLAACAVMVARSLFVRQIVLDLQDGCIILRGVRPGMWKLFQRWVVERIEDSKVIRVRIGYLRERYAGGLISWAPGEPSKGGMFQMFLWVTYGNGGSQSELYYPHLKNVANYTALIACLESRYGDKVEKHLRD